MTALIAFVLFLAQPSVDELVAALEREPSAEARRAMVTRLARIRDPQVMAALEARAVSDPDPDVALLAMEKLRILHSQALLEVFEKRLASNPAGLVSEHQRWVTIAKGTLLPAFLQSPPPVFAVSAKSAIRVLAIGDFGVENPDQKKVAVAAGQWHRKSPFDFGLTTGDNFLPDGVLSPSDPRWKGGWEELYDPLKVPIYATLGNHDWGYSDSPAAEILYARSSPAFRMPATYYSFTAGPVQFFALATDAFSQTQIQWLREELDRSKAPWKLVYGHTPIYSHGVHGDSEKLIRELLPVLKDRADVYLAGHDHDMQHLKPEGKLNFFVVGGSGASIRPPTPGPRTLFAEAFFGFAVIEADAAQFKITFVDSNSQPLYSQTLFR